MAMAGTPNGWASRPRTIHATGGASANREILQVMADVFDADVYRFDSTDSAALGAALRAWQADTNLSWTEVVDAFARPDLEPGHADPAERQHICLAEARVPRL